MILDLPMPPSVNTLWKHSTGPNRVYRNPKYIAWRKECQALCMQFRWHKARIAGPYILWMTLDETQRNGDLDNRLKGVLDILRDMEITDDDSYCEKLGADWGEAPLGCRVTVGPYVPPNHLTTEATSLLPMIEGETV